MAPIVVAVGLLLLALAVRAFALPVAKGVVGSLIWLCTQPLRLEVRERRRAEVQSDFCEHEKDWRDDGYSPDLIAMHVLVRGLGSIPAYLSLIWQRVRRTDHRQEPDEKSRKGHSLAARADSIDMYDTSFDRVFAYVCGRVNDITLTEAVVVSIFKAAILNGVASREDWLVELFVIARNTTAPLIAPKVRVSREVSLPPERSREIDGLLNRLSPLEREVVGLKYDAQLTNPQVAQVLGIHESLVKNILFRVLKEKGQGGQGVLTAP